MMHAVLRPLDRMRASALKALGAMAPPLMVRRELRVALWATTIILLALAGTALAPLLMLAIGPIVLGVPHVLADVRYLVVRPGWHRAKRMAPAAVLLVAVGATASLELGLRAAAAAVWGASRARSARTWLVLVCLVVLVALTAAIGPGDRIVFAHVHNVVAVVLWWVWMPRRGVGQRVPVLLYLAASAAIAAGLLDGAADSLAGLVPGALGLERHAAELAPGIGDPWATRLVLLFAFAQAVHYGVWLRLVPEDDRPRATPRTFRASWDALVSDFGRPALYATMTLAIGVFAWALVDLAAARTGYLRLALFHGHMELAALSLFAAGIGPPTRAR